MMIPTRYRAIDVESEVWLNPRKGVSENHLREVGDTRSARDFWCRSLKWLALSTMIVAALGVVDACVPGLM
jgi:hypothetical protein